MHYRDQFYKQLIDSVILSLGNFVFLFFDHLIYKLDNK